MYYGYLRELKNKEREERDGHVSLVCSGSRGFLALCSFHLSSIKFKKLSDILAEVTSP